MKPSRKAIIHGALPQAIAFPRLWRSETGSLMQMTRYEADSQSDHSRGVAPGYCISAPLAL
jgi:hypothetical protein